MKTFFLAVTAVLLTQIARTQVAISNPASNPDPSAMLDIKSTNRGFLMPRLADRTVISAPATGLLVYETGSDAVWVYNGTAWVQLGSGGSASQWLLNGTHIYNGNTGNVGVGVNAPSSKFHLLGNMLMDGTNPTLQLQNAGVDKGFVQLSGNNLRVGTNSANNSGRFVVRTDNSDRLIVDSTGNVQILGLQDASLTSHGYLTLGSTASANLIFDRNEIMARNNGAAANIVLQNDGGNVGIGVASPEERLSLTNNVKLYGGAPLVKFETAVGGTGTPVSSSKYAPGLLFLREGATTALAKIEYVDTVNYTNFLRFYTGAIPSNDLTVTTGHDVGIGASNPNAKLEVRGTGEVVRIHAGLDPLLQFTTGNAGGGLGLPLEKKGFLDVDGDDFRIGTNSENDDGKFIMRVNGSNVVNITPGYNVGIGTATPEAKLHVAGKIFADAGGEAIKLDGANPNIGFYQSGTYHGFIEQNGTNLFMGVNNGKLRLDAAQVAIGPIVPGASSAYKLTVDGRVVCEELRVKLSSNWTWPDYVFNKNYKLLPLSELQKFIQTNNHLPNIPKASVIEKEGLDVGDMQKRMMEKIEELTLYVLDLQKQIDGLKAEAAKSKNK